MSRLLSQLRAMQAQQTTADPKRAAERESHAAAGDGLEMAARAALEAWQVRPRHPDESDVFRLGYRLACHELALVFRAMRKGQPPSPAEFVELRKLVFEDAATETSAIHVERIGTDVSATPGFLPIVEMSAEEYERVSQRKFNGEHAVDEDDEAPDEARTDPHGSEAPVRNE